MAKEGTKHAPRAGDSVIKKKKSSTSDKKKKSSTSEKKKKSDSVVVKRPVEKKISSKKPVEKAPVEKPPVEKPPVKRVRRKANKESICADISNIMASVQTEIESFKLSDPAKKKTLGVKYLKGLHKNLTQLLNDCKKSIKERKVPTRDNNNSSGFLKPVRISANLAKFTGWDPKEEKSRVDVTKFLCAYIRENNLQREGDKRVIDPDSKLKAILDKDESEPLTYYSLQKRIQHHFIKE